MFILETTSATLFLALVTGSNPSSGSGVLSTSSSISSSTSLFSSSSSSIFCSSPSSGSGSFSYSSLGLGVSVTSLKALVLSKATSLGLRPRYFFSLAKNFFDFFSNSNLYSSNLPSLVVGSGGGGSSFAIGNTSSTS